MGGMVAYWKAGGVFMWPLLGCIIMGGAFIIERIIYFALAKVDANNFMIELKAIIKKDNVDKGIAYCKTNRSPAARVAETALIAYKRVGPNKMLIEDEIVRTGNTELLYLDRGMPIIAAVISIAPVLGFLGTVSGMIHAFQAIAIAGEVEPTLVATGISEALITTAVGLSIAFPVQSFHVFFTMKSNTHINDMNNTSGDVVSFLIEEKP
ncbi:MAG: MotA/TolQ/ExbB proton channel family protein [bacterium]